MKNQHLQRDFTDMRRRDRAVTDDTWIREFLAEAPDAVVATSLDSQPFTHINTFVYDDATHAIYLHTAGQGRLRANIEANEKVSVCASRMGRLLPAGTAREMSVEYDSVIAFGRASIVTDMALAREKMQMLLDKYFGHLQPGRDYRAITDAEISEITVIRIDIGAWSAKRLDAEPDFPGAFHFGDRGEDNG